jgi:DHA1 family bicyclomycin/chloramphenicol resistance-like MFS transporter
MSSPQSRFLVPILCLLAALGIFSTSLYLPSLPAVGQTLGASQESVQLTLALFFLGSAVGSLILGPLSDRLGRLLIAKGGLILFIVSSFWCAESKTISSLLLARFFQGIAAGSGPLVSRAMGRDLYEGSDLTKFSATIMMVISVSPAIAPSLGGLIQFYFGWEKNFYFLMLFGVFVALAVWIWLPETNGHREHVPPLSLKNYLHLLKDSYYGMLCLIIGLQMGAVFCYISLSPYLYISRFGWSPQEFGLVGITSAFGNIAGFAIARRMAHRIHFHQGILTGNALCLLISLSFVGISFFWVETAPLLILYSVCFYGASALAVVNSSAAAMNLYPHMAGSAAALLGAVQIGAGAFGSAFSTLLPDSSLALGIALSGFSLASLILGIIIEKKRWLGR